MVRKLWIDLSGIELNVHKKITHEIEKVSQTVKIKVTTVNLDEFAFSFFNHEIVERLHMMHGRNR